MAKKKRREYDDDDGRVIADMSVAGLPRRVLRRNDEIQFKEKRKKTALDIDKREKKSIIKGVLLAYAVLGLVLFATVALFLLFCTKIWFR